jgi:hypothetical protein
LRFETLYLQARIGVSAAEQLSAHSKRIRSEKS